MNNAVVLSTMAAFLISVPFVFALLCYASAGCLRVAAKWLSFGTIQPGAAFKCACTAMFVVAMANLSVNLQFSMSLFRRGNPNEFMFWALSLNNAITVTISVGLTALIFGRMLYRGVSEKPLSFQNALTLAALHNAILFAGVYLLVGSIVLFVEAVMRFMPFPN